MLRPRPLAIVLVALALITGVLTYAPIGSGQSGLPKLSSTPPVVLAPASPTPTTSAEPVSTPKLPKTGFNTAGLALLGLGFLAAGTTLRRANGRRQIYRRR